MLSEVTINKLVEMHLTPLAHAYRMQLSDPNSVNLGFEERFGMLVDIEYNSRKTNKLKRLIHDAALDQPEANIADINYEAGRKLNKELINRLATCNYITDTRNIIIAGATGSGKTYLACAFGMEACKQFYKTQYVRLPDLLIEIESVRQNPNAYKKVIKKYAKPALLIIDEWLLMKLPQEQQAGIFEILSSRYRKRSTIFCSQYKLEGWYLQLGADAPLTDSILDRVSHNSYVINIEPLDPSKDVSMREFYGLHEAQ